MTAIHTQSEWIQRKLLDNSGVDQYRELTPIDQPNKTLDIHFDRERLAKKAEELDM
jgi:hypothetical protein